MDEKTAPEDPSSSTFRTWTVTTEQGRGALARGTVVRSAKGTIACRFDDQYGVLFGDDRPFTWSALQLPLTVLFDPQTSS